MAKKGTQQPPQPPLRLAAPAEEARQRLSERIDKAKAFLQHRISSPEELDRSEKEYTKWSDYNKELLKQLFTNESIAEEYSRWVPSFISEEESLHDQVESHISNIEGRIHRLESISERIELIPLAEEVKVTLDRPVMPAALSGEKVFIVHGHDEAAREMTARFLERLGLKPIILHEQPNMGKTIIEKLEHYSDVGYAVVLLTPDDEGRKKADREVLRDRARQNVMLELGYFTGRLGRNRVCALHRGSVEIPTDYLGVLYLPLDEGEGWKFRLAKELKAAGFNVDMNKVV